MIYEKIIKDAYFEKHNREINVIWRIVESVSEELKVKLFRAIDKVYEKFKKIATDNFGNQGQGL